MALQRLNLEPKLRKNLQRHGLASAREVLEAHPLVLMEQLDSPAAAIDRLRSTVVRKCLPPPATALQLHQKATAGAGRLPTHLPALDALLGGGVPAGSITELVGPAGIGKSQLCLTLAVSALAQRLSAVPPEDGCVLFLDTERKFSAQRLLQIAAARWPQALGPPGAQQRLAAAVHVVRADTPQELTARLQGLEAAAIERRVRLVVVDSMAVLARADAGGSLPERQALLGQQAALLKQVAERFSLPVVVTNQVTSGGGASEAAFTGEQRGAAGSEAGPAELGAALGTLWAHAVGTRLVLEPGAGSRVVRVAKSPAVAAAAAGYRVTAAGLEPAAPDGPADVGGRGIRGDTYSQLPASSVRR